MEWNQSSLVKVWILKDAGSHTVNRSKFEAVLESIVQYATDTSDASVEKLAFGVLNKMVVVWSRAGQEGAVGFYNAFGEFVIEHLSRVCFEVPSKSTFNSNDAQSRLVSSVLPSLIILGFG
jgi:exportin-T